MERYVHWLGQLLQGNWGESALYRRPVLDIIGERFVNSLALMLCAWVLSGVIGFVLGCLMGMYQGKWPDRLLKKIAYLISSIPTFWLGLVLLLVFSVWLHWFPTGLSAPIGVTQEQVTLGQRLHHLALPALTLSFVSFSNIALHTRQKLIDVLNSEYVLFARARGEGRWTVLRRHGPAEHASAGADAPVRLLCRALRRLRSGGECVQLSRPGQRGGRRRSQRRRAAAAGHHPFLRALRLCGQHHRQPALCVIDPQIREVAP